MEQHNQSAAAAADDESSIFTPEFNRWFDHEINLKLHYYYYSNV